MSGVLRRTATAVIAMAVLLAPGCPQPSFMFPDDLSLTIRFSNMEEHVGQRLELRLIETRTLIERWRKVVTVPSADFIVDGDDRVLQDLSYQLDICADMNDNDRYDPPPEDHAWRLFFNVDWEHVVVEFFHNYHHSDVGWT